MPKNYWLVKSEPGAFSIEDLKNAKNATTCWDGVRNYQARNFMRDDMKKGDLVLYYHSNCDEIGIVGTAEVVREGYPDSTSWDPNSDHYDPKSTPETPRWFMVDLKFKKAFNRTVRLDELKANPKLKTMKVVQKGQRLSVQPVTKTEFDTVCKMAER